MINKNTKKLSDSKLNEQMIGLKKTLLNLNFQKSTGQLEKTHQIRKTKKDIARLKMQISNKDGDTNA
tara:strand:+ start:591 stop:791 length:201 start_codon:yes stop_codon:yes gene_type:complete